MKKSTKKDPASYRQRTYRAIVDAEGLQQSEVTVRETDLQILASEEVKERATRLVLQYRAQLENYLTRQPAFLTSLVPQPFDPLAPPIVKAMLQAARDTNVGPMAAVAGAIAEFVGNDLLDESEEIIVENGGDIFMSLQRDSVVAVFAGESPLSYRLGIKISSDRMPLGICTSSGTVGHSLSLGSSDSVTVLATSTVLADAAATRLGNELKNDDDLNFTLAVAESLPGISGVFIIMGEKLGAWGEIEIVRLSDPTKNLKQ
jgi:ApbE superfamily uncharacterized protein (UPF0280 family)